MDLSVSKLTISQLCRFMHNARRLDLIECYHMTHEEFSDTKLTELGDALCLYDADTNEIYAIGGVEKCTIWMLCTYKVEEHSIPFLRFCKDYLRYLQKTHTYMDNYVWLGNELHVKWLKFMGAKFDRLYTANGQPFQHFYFET